MVTSWLGPARIGTPGTSSGLQPVTLEYSARSGLWPTKIRAITAKCPAVASPVSGKRNCPATKTIFFTDTFSITILSWLNQSSPAWKGTPGLTSTPSNMTLTTFARSLGIDGSSVTVLGAVAPPLCAKATDSEARSVQITARDRTDHSIILPSLCLKCVEKLGASSLFA